MIFISKKSNELRNTWCAATPAIPEIDCEAGNTGLPAQTLCPHGREATSKAFFNAAGILRLCSGVTIINASCALTASRNSVYSAGEASS